jgi:colanic acid/amylovoran biosynthesis glycosyltransferase
MTIAYLTNQYPKISHAFIRREIAAVEKEGVEVVRWAVRRQQEPAVDPIDAAESQKTHVLLDAGPAGLFRAFLRACVTRPLRFAAALLLTLRLGFRSERGLFRHLAYLAEASLLLAWVKHDRVEHVHAHFGTNSATVAMLCHALGGPGYSFTVHGPEEFDQAAQLGLRQKIAGALFVVAVSSFGRSQLYRYTDVGQWPKIKLVRCGVDETFWSPPVPLPAVRRLLSIGRLCEQKGQLLLIEALARLRQGGVRAEVGIIGDGELRPVIEDAIRRGGLSDTVRILGWASGAAIIKALDESQALVLPSFAEGLPVVIMEALARARPVLSTFVAGIPELVVPGRNGWLVPAGSADALANSLRQVLEAPVDQLTEMGQRGREDVRLQHDMGSIARELVALFRTINGPVSEGPAPASK